MLINRQKTLTKEEKTDIYMYRRFKKEHLSSIQTRKLIKRRSSS